MRRDTERPSWGRRVFRVLVTTMAIVLAVGLSGRNAEAETLTLSLPDAVQMALSEGSSVRLAQTRRERARVAEKEALGGLMPQAQAQFIRSSDSINLETFGFSIPGEPPVVGPFNVSDARLTATMQLFNLAAIRRYQALRAASGAGGLRLRQAENDVIQAVAGLYVLDRKAAAQVATRQAEVSLFERLLQVAEDELKAGTATRLDVAQARLQLAQVRQALLAAKMDQQRSQLALLDAIGAEPSDTLVLTDDLGEVTESPDLNAVLDQARAQRPEIRALQAEMEAAKLALGSARARRIPNLELNFLGDESGNSLDDLHWSRTVGAMVTVPLWDPRIPANIARARLDLEDAKTRSDQAVRSVEQEVRQAVLELENARARVEVASEAAEVADQALEIARDRKAAGYGSTVEVDRAQEAYRSAHENLIAARADEALASYALQHATGTIHQLAETRG